MSKITEYNFDKEVELMLTFFQPLIKNSKTREEAEQNIFWMQYMLKYVVEKYYKEKV